MFELFNFFSPGELILCCLIVFVASVIQVSVGMGFGMLASPLIALVKPEIVPGSILIMGLVVALAGAWRERSNIIFTELKWGIAGRAFGSLIAIVLLSQITGIRAFFIVFGFIMLLMVALAALKLQIEFNNRNLFNLSILSGVAGTITGVGAPPMAVIYHSRSPKVVRPTLNAFFFSVSVLGLLSLWITGWFKLDDLFASGVLLPAMLLGILGGEPFRKISSVWLSRILLSLSAIASFALIVRGVF